LAEYGYKAFQPELHITPYGKGVELGYKMWEL
jgi:hypothetical protein